MQATTYRTDQIDDDGEMIRKCGRSIEGMAHDSSNCMVKTSLTVTQGRIVDKELLRAIRVCEVIKGITEQQGSQLYKQVVSVVRDKRSIVETLGTTYPETRVVYRNGQSAPSYEPTGYYNVRRWTNKVLGDEETAIREVADKYFAIKMERPQTPFVTILYTLRNWADSLPTS